MNTTWSWSSYLILVLVYWTLMIAGFVVLQRRRGNSEFEFAGQISNTLLRVGLILLGPPVFGAIVLLLR